jgi:acyl dehydratase
MTVVELSAVPSGPARAALTGLAVRHRPAELPDTTLVLRDVGTELDRLAGYARVCGYRLADTVPPTWPHVLAFPLALALMSGRDFPFPVIGVVHVGNRIEQLRPVGVAERLDFAVHAADLRPHERGRQFDVLATATVAGEPVWRGVSTYLRREATAGTAREPRPDAQPPTGGARWPVGRTVGRDYARVSGDHNPIHTSRVGARLFGFARPIAHGMWSAARCLAALEGRLPDRYTAEVAFKLPVLLPSTVAFTARASGSDWELSLCDARSGKPHLTGAVRSS